MGASAEATKLCLTLAARVLGASSRCVTRGRDLDAGQFARIASSYGVGRGCDPKLVFARSRGRHWWLIDHRLEELLRPPRSALARN